MYQMDDPENAQMILATHSPVLMSYPGADIRQFTGTAIEPIAFEDIEHVRVTRAFLNNPDRILKELFAEDGGAGR